MRPNAPWMLAFAMALSLAGSGLLSARATAQSPPAVTQILFTPSPLAQAGSLAAGQSAPLTVTAEDASGTPVAGASVEITLFEGAGNSSSPAPSDVGSLTTGGKVYASGTSFAATTDSGGQVVLTYQAPPSLPARGTATVQAQTSSTLVSQNLYSFGQPTSYVWSQDPIAPAQSLQANQSVGFDLQAHDASGDETVGAPVYLSFQPTSGGGAAYECSDANCTTYVALDSTPQLFLTDATGYVFLAYVAPPTLPAGGTDSVLAENAPSGATLQSFNGYAFGGPPPVITGFTPASGPVGTTTPVVITGQHFTGATQVSFVPSMAVGFECQDATANRWGGGNCRDQQVTFTVDSDTQITAWSPPDVVDATITVSTPAGTGQSATNFEQYCAGTSCPKLVTTGPFDGSITGGYSAAAPPLRLPRLP